MSKMPFLICLVPFLLFLFLSVCVCVSVSSILGLLYRVAQSQEQAFQKDKLQYASVYQASAGIMLASVLLAKPEFVWEGTGWLCEYWVVRFIGAYQSNSLHNLPSGS